MNKVTARSAHSVFIFSVEYWACTCLGTDIDRQPTYNGAVESSGLIFRLG